MMKIAFISDTHGHHDKLEIPAVDMIICAGDISGRGSLVEVRRFLVWFNALPIQYKLLVAGNHDFLFQNEPDLALLQLSEFPSVIYLQDEGVTIEGIKIYGSPWQPWFHDWAFNLPRSENKEFSSTKGVEATRAKWAEIPDDTDILITHGPPHEILDRTQAGRNVGCPVLLDRVREVRPQVHAFGHIHEGSGVKRLHPTTFVNASICDPRYKPVNPPRTFDYVSSASQ